MRTRLSFVICLAACHDRHYDRAGLTRRSRRGGDGDHDDGLGYARRADRTVVADRVRR